MYICILPPQWIGEEMRIGRNKTLCPIYPTVTDVKRVVPHPKLTSRTGKEI
jgi:hypothetical protein